MNTITLDFETYFDKDYSLSKMTTEEYVRDPRFEVLGLAVLWPGQAADCIWYDRGEIHGFIDIIDWSSTVVLCHHAQFDGLILSHHYGIKPALWLDTLSMGRVCFDGTVSLSLASLADKFSLSAKSVPYDLFKGKHWRDMNAWEQSAVAEGCKHDCALTWQIAQYLLGGHAQVPYPFPPSEIPVVDLTVRMFTEPTLIGDLDLLGAAWTEEEVNRQALFARLGVSASDLRKDATFAAMLEALGVEPQRKITDKGNEKYAFAKSDWFMQDLVLSEDQDIAQLAEARLKAQSSIYQTRAERLGWMATRGRMPVYLSYAAAHTRRWGGGDKTNWQNFPRADPYNPHKGALRRAIKV